jgi:hypothetical protein
MSIKARRKQSMSKKSQSPPDKSRRILSDHKKIGKWLIPPFMQIPNLSETSWVRYMLPEVIWLGLLIRQHGYLKGAELGLQLALTALNTCDSDDNDWFVPISTFSKLTKCQKDKFIADLQSSNDLEIYKNAFIPLAIYYPECPLNFIFQGDIPKADNNTLRNFKSLLIDLYDRRSKCAMLVQGSATYIALGSGILIIYAKNSELYKLPTNLCDYPDSDSSRRVGSEIRATLNAFLGETKRNVGLDWSSYFWNRGLEIEYCGIPRISIHMNDSDRIEDYHRIINEYLELVDIELIERWNNWEIDLENSEIFEVIGSLMARQVALGEHFLYAPLSWNRQIAPVILRSMVELYITLAWIFKDPIDRSRKFIAYGLGQEKLEIEHLKAKLTSNTNGEKNSALNKTIEERLEWLNQQRHDYLTEVNVGSWSGLDTRTMAIEADCLEIFYDQFIPLSASSHNSWHYIGKYNLKLCSNPLHKLHKIPVNDFGNVDFKYVPLCAKWIAEIFNLFDKNIHVKVAPPSAYSFLMAELEKISPPIDSLENCDNLERDSNGK